MATSDIVRAWIDGHIKEEATNVLTRITADKALPFDVSRGQQQTNTKKP